MPMVADVETQQRLCTLADLADGRGTVVRAENRAIALFRVGEAVFAFDNVCPHWGGPLGAGAVSAERMEVTCPWHRFRFDLRSGKNVLSDVRDPATAHPVEIRDGEVFVTIGG